MAKHILKCTTCARYTMQQICPDCKSKTATPEPGKYSPDDQYGSYRREARREILKKQDLI